ncbi:hypothetical protein AB1N83_009602 [Pleurotus pulmonarius]
MSPMKPLTWLLSAEKRCFNGGSFHRELQSLARSTHEASRGLSSFAKTDHPTYCVEHTLRRRLFGQDSPDAALLQSPDKLFYDY